MRKCPIPRRVADFKGRRYSKPAHVAEWLNCSQRTVREYCKQGLIPEARMTEGGHWRIQLPLSTRTKLALSELKYTGLWKGKIGSVNNVTDQLWESWVLIAKLFGLDVITDEFDVVTSDGEPRADAPETLVFKREIMVRMKQRRGIDDLLLKGWITKLYRDGESPTATALARGLEMSRDTFYRRFPRATVKKVRQEVLAGFRQESLPNRTDANP